MELIMARVDQLVPDPDNPRKNFVQSEFDELVASIRAKGVIQPIVIRAYNGGHMIVAGERRWRASIEAGKETIPAVIRDTDNGEVFEIMMIENLMRADITELEEAKGFVKYFKDYPDRTEEELALATGKDPRFIRRRVKIVELPESLLKLWDKNKISFAALEQLLRVEDPEAVYKDALQSTFRGEVTAETIKGIIERRAPSLKEALFDKVDCQGCAHNSKVQLDLYGEDFKADKVRCLKGTCFLDKQKAFLIEEYKDVPGVLVVERPDFQKYTSIVKKRKECKKCEKHVIEIEILSGKKRECCSVKACIHDPVAEKIKGAAPKMKPEKAKEKFYKESLTTLSVPKDKRFKVAMLMMIETDSRFREVAKDMLGLKAANEKDYYFATAGEILAALDKAEDLGPIFNAMVIRYVTRDGYQGKADLSEWLGISAAEGFVVDEWYLKRKQMSEIVDLAKEFKILGVMKEKIRGARPEWTGEFSSLTKKSVIDAFLSCDIKGKVPKEIR